MDPLARKNTDPDFDFDHDLDLDLNLDYGHDHYYLYHLVCLIILLGKLYITGQMVFVRRPEKPDYPVLLRRSGYY